ncbi:tetratricopeptide repeat protein 28-like isoform X3 [Asterias amurensis]|uniref:tetratricopeptide repeat protein 28-like isoform X3 n=1 Tax=Asterias amurensis TaxID=7602 RepID=UPI003AB314F8
MEKLGAKGKDKKPPLKDTKDNAAHSKEPIVPGSNPTNASGGVQMPLEDKRKLFQEKVRLSNEACQNSDFERAIRLYTEALVLDPANHILYSNRSAAHIKLRQYEKALHDATKARELNDKWSKAYYRQGIALQCLGRHADALAAFSSGLSQDPKSLQLLAGLAEAALKSPLKDTFEPTYKQLQSMKLDKSPFVIISVIGQELLAAGYHASSLVVLESALKIGTCSLKLRGSVFSALSSAHWGLANTDKAVAYMQQDLAVAKSLGDQIGECRAHGNLGAAFFSKSNYKEALTHHRFQLVLAMKQKDRNTAAAALSSLGHVYSAIGDYPNALASHKQCVLLAKQLNDKHFEAREVGNVGAVHLALGEFDSALECHKQHLEIAKLLDNRSEEARAFSNLGSAYHYKSDYAKAATYHDQVLTIAKNLQDRTVEARAFAGLGHAARCSGDLEKAKHCHQQQLNIALSTKDKTMEGRACSNLGIIHQSQGQFDTALKLHKAHLMIVTELVDRAGQGRAYGNMGNAYSALGQPEQAVKYHKQELVISREVNDRASEACTQGNLAVAYQSLGMHEKALEHYQSHAKIAGELKDQVSEGRALSNLGNYHSSRGEFRQALPYYENYLKLTKGLNDPIGQGKAYHNLGFAHYSLGNFKEAVQFYEKDLVLARDQKDKVSLGRAYCNLGLAYRTLGNFKRASECQKCFLTIAHHMKNAGGKFRALGNLGDICMAQTDTDSAIKFYEQQLQLAKQVNNKTLEACAYGALGSAHRKIKIYNKALAYHTQELQLCEEMNDLKGECKAHSHLGAVHTSLGKYLDAFKCYEEQLKRANELRDSALQAQAFGNLGISKMNMNLFEDALGYFEEQLATLEQLVGNSVLNDRGRAFGNLAECYEALGDYDEAVRNYDQYLAIAQKMKNSREQDRAYRGLGNVHRAMGSLQQALFCFEKRLVVAHETEDESTRASAYGELGCLHSIMGNFEQAISCLENQLKIAQEMHDKSGQADAACGLGGVYQQMGEYEKALEFHQMDLNIAEESQNLSCQGRAFGNLGVTHESLGNYQKAIMYQEQHLSIAAQVNDRVAKALAYSSLGRVHHALGNFSQAVAYLTQGLQIADQLGRKEDEAKIRHRLGLAQWSNGNLDEAQRQLYRAADLFESIWRETQVGSEYKISLLESQSASYQSLQKVLVAMDRQEEALAVAERSRTRAFVDLLLGRQSGDDASPVDVMDTVLMTVDEILDLVSMQSANVLYFSVASGHLYSWLITPTDGIVKFNDCNLNQLDKSAEEDSLSTCSESTLTNSTLNVTTSAHLDQCIVHAREALGVDTQHSLYRGAGDITSETESEADELLQKHLEELNAKLISGSGGMDNNNQHAAMRLTNRNHVTNSSSRSVASVMSQLSLNGSVMSNSSMMNGAVNKSTKQKQLKSWSGRPPLRVLYDLLVAPMEDMLPQPNGPNTPATDLVLVLEGDLYLVPFSVLKGASSTECLQDRFNLRVVPSLRALNTNRYWEQRATSNSGMVPAVVVANPELPASVTERWGWGALPNAEQEAHLVSEIMGVTPLTGPLATKEALCKSISNAECLHFATSVSWKLSALILSPGHFPTKRAASSPVRQSSVSPTNGENGALEHLDLTDSEESDLESNPDTPALSEFLLTAADILDLQLTAKLVVLSAYASETRSGRITTDGIVGLARAFLAAGAQSVLVPLWYVPEPANKIFMKGLYESLLQGTKASMAVSDAMHSVQEFKQFAHPSNWSGFMLLGCDVRLSNKSAMFGNAIGDLLMSPTKCREALRVLLHLIEKSLQRIHRGPKNPIYTTQQSILKKVGPVRGWQELLKAVGFRFEEQPAKGIPPSVFFPLADPGERLLQASASLQALLGLSQNTLIALSKLLSFSDAAQEIISMLQQVVAKYTRDREGAIQVPVNVKLWRTPGCHELLASLGFDLIDVGKEEVLLITGKQVSRRMLHYTLQALLAVYDPAAAPKSLPLESFSSMESLCSSQSGASGMSGMSLSAMSASSMVSCHSLKSNADMSTAQPIEVSLGKSHKRGKRRNNRQFGVTSTPLSAELTRSGFAYSGENSYASLIGTGMTPLANNTRGISPVPSSGSTTSTPPVPSPVTVDPHQGASRSQIPSRQEIPDEGLFSADGNLTMAPEVLALLNSLNNDPDDTMFSQGRGSATSSRESPLLSSSSTSSKPKKTSSSRESLLGSQDSLSMGMVNPAFVDDTVEFINRSVPVSSSSSVEVKYNKGSSSGIATSSDYKRRRDSNQSRSRSVSPGDVFLPDTASPKCSLYAGSPRQSPARLEPGVTSPRGGSPSAKLLRRTSQSSPARSHSEHGSESRGTPSPHEAIAMKVLHDTMKHMNAVENMQRFTRMKQGKPHQQGQTAEAAVPASPSQSESPHEQTTRGPWKVVDRKSSPIRALFTGANAENSPAQNSTRTPQKPDQGAYARRQGSPTWRKPSPVLQGNPGVVSNNPLSEGPYNSIQDRRYSGSNGQVQGSSLQSTNAGSLESINAQRIRSLKGNGFHNGIDTPQQTQISSQVANERTRPLSSVNNTATLPHTRPIHYVPPSDLTPQSNSKSPLVTPAAPSYFKQPAHQSGQSNGFINPQHAASGLNATSNDRPIASRSNAIPLQPSNYYMSRPESSQSTASSVYSSTSSIPSVIHVQAANSPNHHGAPLTPNHVSYRSNENHSNPQQVPPGASHQPVANGGVGTKLQRGRVGSSDSGRSVTKKVYHSSPC